MARKPANAMTTIFSTGSWISTIWDAGATANQSSGLMGALGMAGSRKYPPGSIKAYVASQQSNALALATISQTSTVDATKLAIQSADVALQKRLQERAALAAKHNVPRLPAGPIGDTFIFFANGSTLDTVKNVLTLSDGRKIDAITGTEWADPKSIIQIGNGSYLNTATNILTMSNGTKIDTVTGLVV